MGRPSKLAIWRQCQAHAADMKAKKLVDIMDVDITRTQALTLSLDGFQADFSRTHTTQEETLSLLLALAKEQEVATWRDRMFAGEKINNTEGRAVLHTALRSKETAPLLVDGKDVRPEIAATQSKMQRFSNEVRDGVWRGATGKTITDIVNIGIGGSDLGPRFVVGALRDLTTGPRVHFVANVDAADINGVLRTLNPETTLFVVVSKTFTTQETLLNANTARTWLVSHLGNQSVAKHFVAVSTNKEAVQSFGIQTDNMFTMWDWVGGRYSLWSAAGLSIALAIGWEGFKALLDGAASMDRHFQTAPLDQNIPVLFALLSLWYRSFWGTSAEAVLPYSERLRDLPRYLQQLNMESNGKSVTREGEAVDYNTGPIIFGECGSVGQHSFHQWLHQGRDIVPAEFIGIAQDDQNRPEHHAVLSAHMKAQIEALRAGRVDPDPARTNLGNKPTFVLTLPTLGPYPLGQLLALYEHKVFVQGVVWNLNSFDQFGVEHGKKLADKILKS
ncbi:MAG: glucose-6-phosphate isomerase [Proteobacteria bacterium]|nr:glucose-6-phosphate isomerase [Pseudomonadota bacterium]